MYVVIENTPGYLPDDDDPPVFEDYADAAEYVRERGQEYADDADANYTVEFGDGWAFVTDHNKMYDLGRNISIEPYEADGWH